jgi:DNA-3-methyladenine glycosylase I
MEGALEVGTDGRARCWWGASPPEYVAYHDKEWGRPVGDDRLLFEKLCLEGFQAGLSWLTILRKRPAFRAAFAGFDIPTVAGFDEADVARLLGDEGIVRHRGKIAAAINNAGLALRLIEEEGSIAAYVWGYAPPALETSPSLRSISPESTAMSRDLKKRGWSFVGPTTVYAFMQAMGLVNDHVVGCWARDEVGAAQASFLSSFPGTDRPTSVLTKPEAPRGAP